MSADRHWTVPGDSQIRIARDEHGVPHIHAAGEADLYRGLGYCHGLDRGLQMLLVRVLGQGRACELLDDSEAMLRLDRFFRRMNFGATAREDLNKLPPAHRACADAYCDGVNQALRKRVPWELKLARCTPEPWTLADSMLTSQLAGYVALAQSQGEMERLLIELVQAGVPRAHLEELFSGLLRDLDVDLVRRVTLGERLIPEAVRWNTAVPRATASNNWVVAGRKTASGQPLLANDPHLEANRLPAIWYEVVLGLGERFCIAATMPGIPAPLLGRTNDLAWGATYSFMDAVDSWVEDCRDGRYRRMTGATETWVPFQQRAEIIKRKKNADVSLTVHENEHGVLDGDPSVPGLYLTTRWAAAGTGAASLSAMFDMLHAPDVATGMDLLGQIETAWNWVLADRHGNIGYQMSGRMPVRRDGCNGLAPLPGWDPANDWRGFVPPGDLPRALNPPSGFIVTANNDLNHLGRVRPINLPMGSYRAERISALLAARDDWTVSTTAHLHTDVYSLQAAQFMVVLRPLLPAGAHGDVLRAWDCGYDLESTGAYLFEKFYRALIAEVFGPVCGAEAARFLIDETGIVTDFYANFDQVLLRPDSVWFGTAGRDAVFQRVAAQTLTGPVRTWGSRQQLLMRHLLLGGRLPRWLGFDHGPVALRGGRATIHQGQIYRSGGRQTSFAPSYRLVTDLSEAAAHTCLAGGPSDRRFSRWYTSDLPNWCAGKYKTLTPGKN